MDLNQLLQLAVPLIPAEYPDENLLLSEASF